MIIDLYGNKYSNLNLITRAENVILIYLSSNIYHRTTNDN